MSAYLTTYDNPFDPSTDFDKWFLFDTQKGYNSCSYLAKVIGETSTMSDTELEEATAYAIDSIVQNDPRGIYLRIDPPEKENDPPLEGLKNIAPYLSAGIE